MEKRTIFLDDQDYQVFLHLLKTYLSPPKKDAPHPLSEVSSYKPVRLRSLPNFNGDLTLLAYCLLPNHFHLLLHQRSRDGMLRFMRSLCTTYVMYFNRKYERVGTLFQDTYKAAWIGEGDTGDTYLVQLSRYIHLNPKIEVTGIDPVSWPYSSYPYYRGKGVAVWVNPQTILKYFQKEGKVNPKGVQERYMHFVEDPNESPKGSVGQLTID